MTKEEFYNQMMKKLENNLKLTEMAIKNGDTLGAPTQMDAVEMATRCVNGDKQHMVEFRNNPNFKQDLMTKVMQTLQACKLNDNKNYMIRAMEYCPEVAINYLSDRLKEDPQFLLEAIKANKEVANLQVVKEFQEENPNFKKQVEAIQTQTSREAKIAEAESLKEQAENLEGQIDDQITRDTEQVK